MYTKDHSSLIAYPTAKNPGGSYAVLEGTTTIEQSAFENAQVATVTMPSTLRTIGSQAFTHSHLTSLTLPDGFESAGYWAFAYAEKLTSVDIGGATSLPDGASYTLAAWPVWTCVRTSAGSRCSTGVP